MHKLPVCTYTYSDMKATLRAGWNESLEEVLELSVSVEKESSIFIHTQASERRSLKAKTEEIKKELRLANKAVIEVS